MSTVASSEGFVREYVVPQDYVLDDDAALARLPWRQVDADPEHPSFSRFVDGQWRIITAREHLDAVLATAKGLIESGVQAGDRVAIMSDTRYEWVLLDAAIWAAGAVTVPIYPSSSSAQVEWIMTNSGSRMLFVENDKGRRVAGGATLGEVEILAIDDGAIDELRGRGFHLADGIVSDRRDTVTLETPASIIYTSGTTGRPKGCVITHRQLASEVRAVLGHPAGVGVREGCKMLMFLPLAHVLARAITYAASEGGANVGFWSDFSSIVDKFGSFKPDVILAVPRVFEKVHDGIRAQALHRGPAVAELFRRGEQVAIEWSRCQGGDGLDNGKTRGPRLRAEHFVFDKLVFGRVREALGGNCRYAISGGGALSDQLAHFFRGLGVPIYEGYGLTESCAAITVNGPGRHRIGTVGQPLSGNGVRIAVSGEIELRGNCVFGSYWENPTATAEVFDDGWFRTGDLGSLDRDGYLRITGRLKEIIVTAGGKNVVPGPMEEVLRGSPLISNAMVVGEGRPFVAALITLDEPGVRRWAGGRGLTDVDLDHLCRNALLQAEIQAVIDEANAAVSHAEAIKKYRLLTKDFTEDSGELTATHKLKRHEVETTRAADIEWLYR